MIKTTRLKLGVPVSITFEVTLSPEPFILNVKYVAGESSRDTRKVNLEEHELTRDNNIEVLSIIAQVHAALSEDDWEKAIVALARKYLPSK